MKCKIMLSLFALLFCFTGEEAFAQRNGSFNANRNGPQRLANPQNIRIKKPILAPIFSERCNEEGKVECDTGNKSFRKCKNGSWENWVRLSPEEAENAENCSRYGHGEDGCWPGAWLGCLIRDGYANVCDSAGTPNGRVSFEFNHEQGRFVLTPEQQHNCALANRGGCWPGQYLCNLRDRYYNICGEDGQQQVGGHLSDNGVLYQTRCLDR